MRCRSLVLNKSTKKQNIVWFNSYGKDENYYGYQWSSAPYNWDKIWSTLYCLTTDYQNSDPTWDPNIKYFKRKDGTDVYAHKYDYILIREKPADWDVNYSSYFFFYPEPYLNTNSVFDPNQMYGFHNNALKYNNYSSEQEGVKNSLIQRLSVIKGELWYKASYGLPLTEKIKNKGIYDAIIINIITEQPDVVNITSFESTVVNRSYVLNFTVLTVYNEEVNIKYTI